MDLGALDVNCSAREQHCISCGVMKLNVMDQPHLSDVPSYSIHSMGPI